MYLCRTLLKWGTALLLSSPAYAQYSNFPPPPQGVTVLTSQFNENITISYKEVNCVS